MVGISQEGKIIIVVFEGRQKDSQGVTLTEAGQIMAETYKCITAMALDGGESSQMLIRRNGQWKEQIRAGAATKKVVGIALTALNSRFAHLLGFSRGTFPSPNNGRQISTALVIVKN